jgi:hypothetical protein
VQLADDSTGANQMGNTALWVLQSLLALAFTATGGAKVALAREQLATRMHWAASWPRERIKALGLAELGGAAGLLVPGLTGLSGWLTPLAAACLAALMVGAIQTHRRLGEGFAPAAVVGGLCLLVTLGRLLGS